MLYIDKQSFFFGYCEAMEDIMSFMNSFDTEEISKEEIRSAIHKFAMEARPRG